MNFSSTDKPIIALISLFMFFCYTISAQYDNVWVWGRELNGGGLDFNTDPPTPFQTTFNAGWGEGSAMICDENGQLLFYTEGSNVWDKDGNIMPNGSGLVPIQCYPGYSPSSSASQGTAIIPVPNSPSLYYVFSLTAVAECYLYNANGDFGNLYYSLIDMRLNGGLGDVVDSQKAVLIEKNNTECMIPVLGSNCNGWLLTTSFHKNEFIAYEITQDGLQQTPVISSINSTFIQHQSGNTLAVSPNREQLALASNNSMARYGSLSPRDGLVLYDFDPSNGVVSNERIINNNQAYYGVCFSPDGSKLYASTFIPYEGIIVEIHQFDLTAGSTQQIQNSRYIAGRVTSYWWYSHLRLAPNGKIYFHSNSNELGVIHNPNESRASSNLELGNVRMLNHSNWLGLPNVTIKLGHIPQIEISPQDTILCSSLPLTLNLISPTQEGVKYKWSDGTEGDSLLINKSGKYWVTAEVEGCTRSDTAIVDMVDFNKGLGEDTFFCWGEEIYIQKEIENISPRSQVLWSTGSTSPSIVIKDTGVYWVSISLGDCIQTDTIKIISEKCNCWIDIPNAFSPNGDGLNDEFFPIIEPACPIKYYEFRIFNRYGELVFQTVQRQKGWDGTYQGNPADLGVYFYELRFLGGARERNEFYKKGDVTLVR